MTLEEKAAEILAGRRLTVTRIGTGDGAIVANCLSSDGLALYHLGFDPRRKQWRCTCPTPTTKACSHLAALRLVVDDPTR